MTQEEKDALLAEAKRRYPVDSVIISPTTGNKFTVKNVHGFHENGNIECNDKNGGRRNCYDKSKLSPWAEIVSTPQPQFEVGDNVYSKNKSGAKDLSGYYYESVAASESRKIAEIKEDRIRLSGDSFTWFYAKDFELADKLVAAKDEEWEPKVGDWVTCIDGDEWYTGGAGWELGLTFKITDAINGGRRCYYGGKNEHGVYASHFRKALPHEIPGNEQQKQVLINNSQFNTKQNGKQNSKGSIIEVCAAYPEIISGKRRRAEIVEGRGCEVQVRARPKRNPQSINA